VKLVIRKSDGKLLYAQGEHDFANILFSFLTSSIKRYVTYYCYYKPRDYNVEGIGRYQTFITNESASNVLYDCTLLPHIPTTSYEGYVKGPRIYVATDDLVIAPLSPSTLLHLLDRFETPFEDLMEKVVTIGIKEVVKIKIFFSFIVLLLLLKFNAR
jgi:hypothetical protein